jgi:hypothetical protein
VLGLANVQLNEISVLSIDSFVSVLTYPTSTIEKLKNDNIEVDHLTS